MKFKKKREKNDGNGDRTQAHLGVPCPVPPGPPPRSNARQGAVKGPTGACQRPGWDLAGAGWGRLGPGKKVKFFSACGFFFGGGPFKFCKLVPASISKPAIILTS